jgi:hypothetical protein
MKLVFLPSRNKKLVFFNLTFFTKMVKTPNFDSWQEIANMPLCGGTSDAKEVNDEVRAICTEVGVAQLTHRNRSNLRLEGECIYACRTIK